MTYSLSIHEDSGPEEKKSEVCWDTEVSKLKGLVNRGMSCPVRLTTNQSPSTPSSQSFIHQDSYSSLIPMTYLQNSPWLLSTLAPPGTPERGHPIPPTHRTIP
jgi:hypothetical protein